MVYSGGLRFSLFLSFIILSFMATPIRPWKESYTCTRCHTHKPRTEFYKRKNRVSGCMSECKTCIIKRNQNTYHKDPILKNDSRAARKYGTTLEHIQQLREEAGGVCPCCGRDGLHHHSRLVIDHDHKTGKIRGLLCSRCNSILGFADDNINTLNYLIKHLQQ